MPVKPRHNFKPGAKPPIRKTPFVVILGFMLLGIIGIATGEPQRVLEQAILICLSCIGIG